LAEIGTATDPLINLTDLCEFRFNVNETLPGYEAESPHAVKDAHSLIWKTFYERVRLTGGEALRLLQLGCKICGKVNCGFPPLQSGMKMHRSLTPFITLNAIPGHGIIGTKKTKESFLDSPPAYRSNSPTFKNYRDRELGTGKEACSARYDSIS
jgi:hypothetical protein